MHYIITVIITFSIFYLINNLYVDVINKLNDNRTNNLHKITLNICVTLFVVGCLLYTGSNIEEINKVKVSSKEYKNFKLEQEVQVEISKSEYKEFLKWRNSKTVK